AGRRIVDQGQRGARRFRREALPGRPRAPAAAGPGGGGRQPERFGLLHRRGHARAPRRGRGGPSTVHRGRRRKQPLRQRLGRLDRFRRRPVRQPAGAASADGRTLYVANGKGNGSGANTDGTYIGNVITGSVSIIPVPDSAGLRRYTSQVYALSPFSNARLRPTVRPSDHPPELKHVVYIIRENRTYDQVFGAVAHGSGDARSSPGTR